MDRPRGYYAKMKCQTKTNTVHYHLHVESKKKKGMNTTKHEQIHRYKKQASGEEGRAS